jgi:hypothetical protein
LKIKDLSCRADWHTGCLNSSASDSSLFLFQNQNRKEASMRWNSFSKQQSEGSSTATPKSSRLASDLIRDGFRVLKVEFELPQDSIFFKTEIKRDLTICNMFVNHQLSIAQVAHVLDEDFGKIVRTLIKQRIIQDRRTKSVLWPLDLERRKNGLRTSGRRF